MADDSRTRSATDANSSRKDSRLGRLVSGVSPFFSLLSLLIAVATASWVFLIGRQDTSAAALKSYSFSSPEDAMRSVLQMRKEGQFTALRSFDVAFNSAVIEEKLSSLQIEKVREYDGRRILFVTYRERGDTKHGTEAYIRDAHSGLWGPTRYDYYDVGDRDLANEMRAWLEVDRARG